MSWKVLVTHSLRWWKVIAGILPEMFLLLFHRTGNADPLGLWAYADTFRLWLRDPEVMHRIKRVLLLPAAIPYILAKVMGWLTHSWLHQDFKHQVDVIGDTLTMLHALDQAGASLSAEEKQLIGPLEDALRRARQALDRVKETPAQNFMEAAYPWFFVLGVNTLIVGGAGGLLLFFPILGNMMSVLIFGALLMLIGGTLFLLPGLISYLAMDPPVEHQVHLRLGIQHNSETAAVMGVGAALMILLAIFFLKMLGFLGS